MSENAMSYKQFWGNVFPEFEGDEKLDDYLIKVFGKRIGEIETQAKNETNDLKKYRKTLDAFISKDEMHRMRFFFFYEPIVAEYVDVLKDKLNGCSVIKENTGFVRGYIFRVSDRLCNIVIRTMIEEISEAKNRHLLKGNDSNERYQFFIHEMLREDEYREKIYKKYPELVRLLDTTCKLSSDYLASVIDEVALVYEQLNKAFGKGEELGKITDVRFSLGDAHCDGKSVACVVFENTKVYYKPRECDVDLGFQELLTRLNMQKEFEDNKLKTIKIVKAKHGSFIENIVYRGCETEHQIHEYFRKMGILCCLMYLINARDLHFENIIACGSDPVMIDLESILSAEPKSREFDKEGAYHKAVEYLLDSVQSIGILPNKIRFGDSDSSFNTGGIIYRENQVAPLKSVKLVNDGTDSVYLTREYGTIKGKENLPTYNGKVVDSIDYLDDLSQGFSLMYRFILNKKEMFIAWVEELFGNARMRIILRPTYYYGQLQSISQHPYFMFSTIEREMVLSRIGIYETEPRLIRSEIRAMKRGDIPYYSMKFDEIDLYDGYGVKMPAKMVSSPKAHFRKKMSSVSEAELEKQLELIRISFYSVSSNRFNTKIKFGAALSKQSAVCEGEYLEVAKQIGDYLIDTAFTGVSNAGQKDAFWIHSTTDKLDSNDWSYGVSDLDFYNGNSGIALFLQNLWKITREQKYIDISRAAIEPIIRVIEDGTYNCTQFVGGYVGIGSYIYILYKAFSISKEDRVRNALTKCMEVIEGCVINTKETDLIGGTTGLLTILLTVYQNTEDQDLKRVIESKFPVVYTHIEKILGQKDRTSCYSGYAHGVAAVLPALYRLYLINGEKKVYRSFVKLLEHEREHFWNDEAKVWKTSDEKEGFSKAWCHGAPGILLAWLLLKREGYTDERLNYEIEWCIENVKKECIGYNIVYCHGDIGNLDILRFASLVLKDEKLESDCQKTYQMLFKKHIQHGWNKEDAEYSKCKGMMLGISGIGYSILRAIKREETDDFLWLE